VDYTYKIGKDIEVITGYDFLVLIWKMFVKIRPVRVSTIVGIFRKMPVQISVFIMVCLEFRPFSIHP
jgi:hypothetical protein